MTTQNWCPKAIIRSTIIPHMNLMKPHFLLLYVGLDLGKKEIERRKGRTLVFKTIWALKQTPYFKDMPYLYWITSVLTFITWFVGLLELR